jgi:hypothetical protein
VVIWIFRNKRFVFTQTKARNFDPEPQLPTGADKLQLSAV